MKGEEFAVLVVEDDDNDILLVEKAFAKAELSNPILAVKDGEQAVAYLLGEGKFADRKQFPLPRLILMDLTMPRMSGLEVLAWLQDHRRFQVIPVVVWTSTQDEEKIRRAYQLGANSVMIKPCQFDEFKKMIRMIGDYWFHLGQCELIKLENGESERPVIS